MCHQSYRLSFGCILIGMLFLLTNYFGALSAKGKLPVGRPGHPHRRRYQSWAMPTPEVVHMDSQVLQNIDHIAEEAIADGSTSGRQVLIARKGKVV